MLQQLGCGRRRTTNRMGLRNPQYLLVPLLVCHLQLLEQHVHLPMKSAVSLLASSPKLPEPMHLLTTLITVSSIFCLPDSGQCKKRKCEAIN